jgi:aspartyl protease family protein
MDGTMRQLLYFAIAALGIAAFVPKLYPTANTATVTTPAQADTRSTVEAGHRVTIAQSSNGHFQTEVAIDGRRIDFMVDTGASMIVLRERDAATLGIFPVPADYTALISTANGNVKAARVSLKRVDVGNVTVRDVSALVLPDQALSQNLLGMSFLSRVNWSQKNGKLILEQ